MSEMDPRSSHASDGDEPSEPIPLGQRLLDSPFLLLAAGLFVMFVFFTAWGIYEITTLPQAPLP